MNYQDYKLIIDTDIGDDIDDAFALGLALKMNCDLIAVTTVFKNTKKRALQAKQLISIAGKDIPVYAGETYPVNGVITPFFIKEDDLANVLPCQYDEGMEQFKYENDGAVDAIIKYAKIYSGKLVLAPIGPLTNIAKALKKDPSIKNDIHAIYCMGGCFSYVSPEWNVLCDAEAAQIVYSSGVPFYSVGFDITTKCPLDGNLLDDLRASNEPITKKIFTWFDRWMNYFKFEKSVMHDPLALSTFISDDIVEYKKVYAKVVLDGEKRGAVLTSDVEEDGFSPIYVAASVKKENFFKLVRQNF